jgi:Gluconate 2-dehydrogenase subunit 3
MRAQKQVLPMQRRRALQVLGSLAALPALDVISGRGLLTATDLAELGARAHATAERNAAPRLLSPAQYQSVVTAAEIIIPRTTTPGATDANVADFVDVMLADWYAPEDRDRFLAGLATLDTRATTTCGGAFLSCNDAQRVALFTDIDHEVATLRETDARAANEHWFGMLKFLTVWGFYTSRAGIVDELRQDLLPGYYDGDVAYHPAEAPNAP